jgi:hypothetical protein
MIKKILFVLTCALIIFLGFFAYSKLASKESLNPKITITEKTKASPTPLAEKDKEAEKKAGISICNKIENQKAKTECFEAIKSADQK